MMELGMIGLMLLMHLLGMALDLCFYAACAYYIAKMGRKGWEAGK